MKEDNPKQSPQLSLDAPTITIRGGEEKDKDDGKVKLKEDNPIQPQQLSLDAPIIIIRGMRIRTKLMTK